MQPASDDIDPIRTISKTWTQPKTSHGAGMPVTTPYPIVQCRARRFRSLPYKYSRTIRLISANEIAKPTGSCQYRIDRQWDRRQVDRAPARIGLPVGRNCSASADSYRPSKPGAKVTRETTKTDPPVANAIGQSGGHIPDDLLSTLLMFPHQRGQNLVTSGNPALKCSIKFHVRDPVLMYGSCRCHVI